MKKPLLFIFIALLSLGAQAQSVEDTVFIGAGYSNQSYYSLAADEVSNIPNDDWDIALESGIFGVTIRINAQMGTEMFMYTAGDTADWASPDTANITDNPLYDSDAYWEYGAGTANTDPDNELDFGWGVYNPITHNVVGDSLFILKLSDGSWKKFWMERMDAIANMIYFKYADINGDNEVSVSIDKSLYSDKNFYYYSLQNDEELDREPANDTWDIVFSKYLGMLSPGVYYPVTGALHNKHARSSQADDVDVNDAVWSDYSFNDSINTIGHDWKAFDFTQGWVLAEDRCYFVEDVEGNIWKIVFTYFGGSSEGEIRFTKEQVGTVGIEEATITDFVMYPNPLQNGQPLNLMFHSEMDNVALTIMDLSGKIVHQDQFVNRNDQLQQISLDHLRSGMYIVSLQSGSSMITKKVVVE